MEVQLLAIERKLNRIEFLLIELTEKCKDSAVGINRNSLTSSKKKKSNYSKNNQEAKHG
jgi:hypothetical protein